MYQKLSIIEGSDMKLAEILPKKLAIAWYECHIRRLRSDFEYHKGMAFVLGQLLDEKVIELKDFAMGEKNE